MRIITGNDLPEMGGTFLNPTHSVPLSWKTILSSGPATVVLTNGTSTAALALKVWPYLQENITCLVVPCVSFPWNNSGNIGPAFSVPDPAAAESLLNTGIPVILCPENIADSLALTSAELACDVARTPEAYNMQACGVHAEFRPGSPAYGRLFADYASDKKFNSKNACIVLSKQPQQL